jgi:hypothetical protein
MIERAISWWRRVIGGSEPDAHPRQPPIGGIRWSSAPRASANGGRRRRGGGVSALRTREVAHFLAFIRDWAPTEPAFRAIALTGSWATDNASMTSDIDLICLCDHADRFLRELEWTEPLGYLEEALAHDWGDFTGLRFVLTSGLAIDWGFAPSSWAAVDPVDPGARAVVEDGFSILHDPERLLAKLVHACDALTAAEYRQILNDRG